MATKSTDAGDRTFQLAAGGGAALLAAILFAVRFCSGVPMPAKPPAPTRSRVGRRRLLASADATPIAYKNYVESDAAAAAVAVPTVADMGKKLVYRVDEAHHGLEPGDPPLDVAGLRLSVIAVGRREHARPGPRHREPGRPRPRLRHRHQAELRDARVRGARHPAVQRDGRAPPRRRPAERVRVARRHGARDRSGRDARAVAARGLLRESSSPAGDRNRAAPGPGPQAAPADGRPSLQRGRCHRAFVPGWNRVR